MQVALPDHQTSQDFQALQLELLDLVSLLQQLNTVQLKALCQFVQNNQPGSPELWIPQLFPVLQKVKPEQVELLVNVSSRQTDEIEDEEVKKQFETLARDHNFPAKELENTFGVVVALYHLQQLLENLSILQLMKLFEIVPNGPPIQQLQLLQQIQQLFAQLLPETLQSLHKQLEQAEPGTEQQTLIQLLNLPSEYFHLYQPFRMLLQLDLEELIRLQVVFPKLLPVQMLQLLQLLQLQPFDVLELRNLLSGSDLFAPDVDLENAQPSFSQTPMDGSAPTPSSEKKATLQIVEQPPEKSVYKRNLKPNPMVMIVGDQKLNDGNLYVVPSLVRCDTFTEENKYITGNKPVRVTSGRVLTFRKLKITTTSHQQQETLFCIKFELRRYVNEDEFEVLDTVHSNPICVLSHSTQMKPVPTVAPTIVEVIPAYGPSSGGTRVCIVGGNFAESPAARIRFDNSDVMPIFHGPGTLICHTPQHAPGTVNVKVCNSNKKWSETSASFTYVDSNSNFNDDLQISAATRLGNAPGSLNQGFPSNFTAPSNSSSSPSTSPPTGGNYSAFHHVVAWGLFEACLELIKFVDVNKRDHLGATPLFYAAAFGYLNIMELLVQAGAEINLPNFRGITPLIAAVIEGNLTCVDYLFKRGASLTHQCEGGWNALHCAVQCGHDDIVNYLLRHGCFVNCKDWDGDTALHWAVRESNFRIAQMLLDQPGIAIDSCNDHQESPLHLAAALDETQIGLLLLSRGASPNQIDACGETPLHEACSVRNLKMMELLVHYGSFLDAQNGLGETPLHVAYQSQFPEAIITLTVLGADHDLRDCAGTTPKACSYFGATPLCDTQIAMGLSNLSLSCGNSLPSTVLESPQCLYII